MTRFIPNNHAGNRQDTVVLLIGTAKEFGIDVHEVRTDPNRTGFNISDALADILDEQTKTSGNRAAKKSKNRNSQKGNKA